ncbi:MAG TPA: orotidine-5'-phosphate decarboxylase [Candidatus Saccharimonadales bacterium]|nr:orotidine-5'-phosphate decarboxylase [Candidatus Saccharimonadales bacterium]
MTELATSLDKLRAGVVRAGVPFCLGIDPHPDALPDGLPPTIDGVERFARGLLAAVGEMAAAIKVNVAFFEAFGSAGWAALERLVADCDREQFLILDAKRGDIGSTAERQAESLLGRLGADAVTLSPYLGEDAIEPFLAHGGRMVYVLARTSNPSAGTLQDLSVAGVPLDEHVARWAATRWPDGRVGLVVGATVPSALTRLRAAAPGPGFLVLGVGVQGGDLAAAMASCAGTLAPGLVSTSRAVAAASRGADWEVAAASAARAYIGRMREAGARLSA